MARRHSLRARRLADGCPRRALGSARLAALAAVGALAVLLGACGGGSALAPVQERPGALSNARGQHVVRRGESLYLIAWRHGLDYRRLARANGIGPPYRIVPGQRIALREVPSPRQAAPSRSPVVSQSADKKATPRAAPTVRRAPRPAPAKPPRQIAARPAPPGDAASAGTDENARSSSTSSTKEVKNSKSGSAQAPKFRWPTRGEVIGRFGKKGGKGIDIGGKEGQAVTAAAAGEVVYVGDALLGYGNLIILKHEQNYLSAYAHNQAVLVKEGESVPAGKKIARLGSSGTDRPKLHFELRRNGKPVDPGNHLVR